MAGPYSSVDERNYVGIGKQSAKGTGVAPSLFIPYIGSVTNNHGLGGDEVREGGAGLYVARMRKTQHDPAGSFSFAARPSTVGKLLAWFLGDDTISGAGPYTHTLAVLATNTWLSVERNIADEIIDRFVDGMIRKITLSGDGGGDLMVGVEWSALTVARQSSATAETYDTADPFQQDEAAFTIDGGVVTDVRNWSVEFEWQTDDDVRLSKVTRGQLPKLGIKGTVKVRQLVDDDTEYRAANYTSGSGSAPNKDFNVAGSFSVTFDNGLATTSNRQLTVTMNKVSWREAVLTEPNPDGETVYLERTGVMLKTTTTLSVVAITGDNTAYDT